MLFSAGDMQVVQLLPRPGPVQGFPAGGGAGPPCLVVPVSEP
jgi:hypothetical protein